MTKDQFILYLKQPELLDQNTVGGLKEIIADYPFFPAARMLYLRNLLNINSYKFESELTRHALFIPDRRKLFKLLNTTKGSEFELLPFDKEAFKNFFNESLPNDNASFTYAETQPFSLIGNEKQAVCDETATSNDLIDKFINENPTISPVQSVKPKQKSKVESSDDVVSDDLITDTLASIYVGQGLYDEALNAYEKLILKFPEKNTYFASQIEKIKKLKSKKI